VTVLVPVIHAVQRRDGGPLSNDVELEIVFNSQAIDGRRSMDARDKPGPDAAGHKRGADSPRNFT
jgi:hypothetical protein